MSHYALSPTAESLRQQLKALISSAVPKSTTPGVEEVAYFEEHRNGVKVYGGLSIIQKATELARHMDLVQNWGWSLSQFSRPIPIINIYARMYLVPLSDNVTLTPGVDLKEGFCTLIAGQPTVNANSVVLFISPV